MSILGKKCPYYPFLLHKLLSFSSENRAILLLDVTDV